MQVPVGKATSKRIGFFIFDLSQSSPTLAAGLANAGSLRVQYSINGAIFVNSANAPVEIEDGAYYIDLDPSEMTLEGPILMRAFVNAAEAVWETRNTAYQPWLTIVDIEDKSWLSDENIEVFAQFGADAANKTADFIWRRALEDIINADHIGITAIHPYSIISALAFLTFPRQVVNGKIQWILPSDLTTVFMEASIDGVNNLNNAPNNIGPLQFPA